MVTRELRNYGTSCRRSQFVEYNSSKTEKLPIDTGVPQGSVLGPLLFLMCI